MFSYLDRAKLFVQMEASVAREVFNFSVEVVQNHLLPDTTICQFHIDDYDFNRETLAEKNIYPDTSFDFRLQYDALPLKIFYQDEVIYRSYEATKRFWHMERDQGIRKKGEGVGVMLSGFVGEEDGFVFLTHEQFENFKEKYNPNPQYYIEHEGKFYFSCFFFELGKNRDGYWKGDDMLEHTKEFVSVLEYLYPDHQFLFLYDWSSGHAKYPEGAPNAKNMGVNHGGKQPLFRHAHILQDFEYPADFPAALPRYKIGMLQPMVFQEHDPPPFSKPNLSKEQYVGKAKGLRQVLYERGLFKPGMTQYGANNNADDNTSLEFVLSQCVDFKMQKTALEEHITNRGHLCDFLPKFHPELSPIERCWCVSKRYVRARCRYSYDNMLQKIKHSLFNEECLSNKMISNFFRKTRDYMRAYLGGSTSYNDIQMTLKQYKSHRSPPPSEAITHKFRPYEKKKALQAKCMKDMLQLFDAMCLSDTTESLEEDLHSITQHFTHALHIVEEEYVRI
jgi:hypothetical protein